MRKYSTGISNWLTEKFISSQLNHPIKFSHISKRKKNQNIYYEKTAVSTNIITNLYIICADDKSIFRRMGWEPPDIKKVTDDNKKNVNLK